MSTVRVIGSGSFGIVEEFPTSNGILAKKKLLTSTDEQENRELRRRFKREVEYQSRLNHQNIVPIISCDLDSNTPWFTMPLAECHLGAESTQLTINDKINISHMIIDGIECIHLSGQIHRDLKPANILRFQSIDNSQYCYAISDFGLVADRSRENSTVLTMTNTGMGTLPYMPLECYTNAQSATFQSDIYSLGVILKFIFDGETGNPLRERSSNSIIASVISKCTKDNMNERYSSIAELRSDFINLTAEMTAV
jgi:serine/threonine protein kinase